MTFIGNGTYTLTGLSASAEGTYTIIIEATETAQYDAAVHEVTLVVNLHPLIRAAFQWGAITGLVGMIGLGGWLVFSIPWLVRKMRSMARTIGRGKTPTLSKRDLRRISDRNNQLTDLVEPAYNATGITLPVTAVPGAVAVEERTAEEEEIWRELEQLEGLGPEEKRELFEEMKRIPPKDRVWFLEDLKRQMAEGVRFAPPKPKPPEKPPAPEAPEEISSVEEEIMRRLDAIPSLSEEEKKHLLEQLRELTPEEREEVFRTLEEESQGG